jgi:hypothetical protein
MLQYKAELVGIRVIVSEESYTSTCSFLDLEPIGKHAVYAGKRIKRGWFRASAGRCLNARRIGRGGDIAQSVRRLRSDRLLNRPARPLCPISVLLAATPFSIG